MSEPPERIYLQWDWGRTHPNYEVTWSNEPVDLEDHEDIEYVRSDVFKQLSDACEKALEELSSYGSHPIWLKKAIALAKGEEYVPPKSSIR